MRPRRGGARPAKRCWSVYLIRRRDGALYAGIATDVVRRLRQHREGRGAKALRGRGPLELVFHRQIGDRGQALRVELRIKRLRKVQKEQLIVSARRVARLIAASC